MGDEGDKKSEDDIFRDVIVHTQDEILYKGLKLVHFTSKQIKKAKRKRNYVRFKGHFGSHPDVIAVLWEDLQTTAINEARLDSKNRNIEHFLMAMHHLKRYPRGLEREATFGMPVNAATDLIWYYIEKVRALLPQKVYWPSDNFGSDKWVITVDGTHCWIQEPKHPTWSMDPEYYSHKYGKAGLCYELGISLWEGRLVWLNGPFPAGFSDRKIFKEFGLKEKLKTTGKKGIADGGYTGHPNQLSTPNNRHDDKNVKTFKSRALKRHEKFNGMTKEFDCLSDRFRHSKDRFRDCFEAICVICQYQLENGHALYDILIPELFEE